MHNMIIEDERDLQNTDDDYETYEETSSIQISREHTNTIKEFMQFITELEIRVLIFSYKMTL